MAEVLAISLFAAGYLAITMEHRIFINKAAASLILAVTLWAVAGVTLSQAEMSHYLVEAGSDLFSLLIFLLAAMTLVEILVHYHLFDMIEYKLRTRNLNRLQLGWAIAGLTFLLSSFLANLTVVIVMIQIARRLFPSRELLYISSLIIITSNAGGAFSPIGDVTTLMLWFADKFSASEVIIGGFLPSVVTAVIPALLIMKAIPKKAPLKCLHNGFHPSRSDRAVIGTTIFAFFLPLVASLFHLPPYMGLLAGLGLVWVFIDIAKRARPQETHLDANIKTFLQHTDIESLQFFVGILLAVSALHALGLLGSFTELLLGDAPTIMRFIAAFAGLGVGSAIVDNVPITAVAINALPDVSSSLWVLLAVLVGTGGSLLVIGSAAGVIAMGMVKELTFSKYFKIAAYPALLGFAGAIVIWALQTNLPF